MSEEAGAAVPQESAGPEQSSGPVDVEQVKQGVVDMLKTCYDPEIPVDIYELGLIYEVDVQADGKTEVRMTLTSPACPVAGTLPPEVEQKVATVEGVSSARVDVVWDPPWDKDMMSEAAQLELGLM